MHVPIKTTNTEKPNRRHIRAHLKSGMYKQYSRCLDARHTHLSWCRCCWSGTFGPQDGTTGYFGVSGLCGWCLWTEGPSWPPLSAAGTLGWCLHLKCPWLKLNKRDKYINRHIDIDKKGWKYQNNFNGADMFIHIILHYVTLQIWHANKCNAAYCIVWLLTCKYLHISNCLLFSVCSHKLKSQQICLFMELFRVSLNMRSHPAVTTATLHFLRSVLPSGQTSCDCICMLFNSNKLIWFPSSSQTTKWLQSLKCVKSLNPVFAWSCFAPVLLLFLYTKWGYHAVKATRKIMKSPNQVITDCLMFDMAHLQCK